MAGNLHVSAPATAANLGPGFDSFGLAIDLRNEITVQRSDKLQVLIEGEGKEFLPTDENNLVVKTTYFALNKHNVEVSPLRFYCVNRIPVGAGLGSSAAAIVCGLMAGSMLAKNSYDVDAILQWAAELDCHPDNVGPCIKGGMCITSMDAPYTFKVPTDDDNEREKHRLEAPRFARQLPVFAHNIPYSPCLSYVFFIRETQLKTTESRNALPQRVAMTDAVYNISRGSLFVLAISTGNFKLLEVAMMDRLHQAARLGLIPHLNAFYSAGMAAGAHGVCVSGAGPSILAIVSDVCTSNEVKDAFECTAKEMQLKGKVVCYTPSDVGVKIKYVDAPHTF